MDIVVNGRDGHAEQTPAFRAAKVDWQDYDNADELVKVFFTGVQFDNGDIYNANTSTFVPSEDGVYFVAGKVTFFPKNDAIPFRARLEVRVNGESVAADNEYFLSGVVPSMVFANIVNTSTILQLQAGDLVEIFFTSTSRGIIDDDRDGSSTRFEAAGI
ncbi:hypothetical protein LG307_20230 [Sutcliffiella horikoshii]|uniref:hypothetical protein n=1 Tax=Sutcliffiella horikoshii TaxID=79883 RepID=UPI00384CA049